MLIAAVRRLLEDKLSAEDWQSLVHLFQERRPEEYDGVLARALRRFRRHETELERADEMAQRECRRFLELPAGRRETLLQNSRPEMLWALARRLLEESYRLRFSDRRACLELAQAAVEVAARVRTSGHLPPRVAADLEGSAWSNLGNARRINGELRGAGRALARAGDLLAAGTGSPWNRGDLASKRAALLSERGELEEAAAAFEGAIRLWRQSGDREKLGMALMNRGFTAMLLDDLATGISFFQQGIELVDDPMLLFLPLHPTAEGFARRGRGEEAWKLLITAERFLNIVEATSLVEAEPRRLEVRHRWIRGLTYRALSRLDDAERELGTVQRDFVREDETHQAAVVSMDLACVYADQGRWSDLRILAREVYPIFRSEGVAKEAMRAFLYFHRACQREAASVEVVRRVADFLQRHQRDPRLRFRP